MATIKVFTALLFGQAYKLRLYNSPTRKTCRIHHLLFDGTSKSVVVECYNEQIHLTGLQARLAFRLM